MVQFNAVVEVFKVIFRPNFILKTLPLPKIHNVLNLLCFQQCLSLLQENNLEPILNHVDYTNLTKE